MNISSKHHISPIKGIFEWDMGTYRGFYILHKDIGVLTK